MAENTNYDSLKLENQLCFPLYACAKEVVRRYKPFLDEIDLTYTQYITMMVMWEHREISTKEMGTLLYLDSGTLTPVLKTLEKKGHLTRHRSETDERNLIVTITQQGEALKEKAVKIPIQLASCLPMDPQDAMDLYRILKKLLKSFESPAKKTPQ